MIDDYGFMVHEPTVEFGDAGEAPLPTNYTALFICGPDLICALRSQNGTVALVDLYGASDGQVLGQQAIKTANHWISTGIWDKIHDNVMVLDGWKYYVLNASQFFDSGLSGTHLKSDYLMKDILGCSDDHYADYGGYDSFIESFAQAQQLQVLVASRNESGQWDLTVEGLRPGWEVDASLAQASWFNSLHMFGHARVEHVIIGVIVAFVCLTVLVIVTVYLALRHSGSKKLGGEDSLGTSSNGSKSSNINGGHDSGISAESLASHINGKESAKVI